jgi:hypothetical protein
MPWSRTSEGSLAIYGDEGEWIATCANAAIAGEIVGIHNSPGRNSKLSTLSTGISTSASPLRLKGSFRRFNADVDAIVDITDGHLATQALKNDGWTTTL